MTPKPGAYYLVYPYSTFRESVRVMKCVATLDAGRHAFTDDSMPGDVSWDAITEDCVIRQASRWEATQASFAWMMTKMLIGVCAVAAAGAAIIISLCAFVVK